MRRWTLSGAVALLVSSAGCSGPGRELPQYPTQNADLSAVELEVVTFPNATKASLAALRGRVVLLDVWATWCQPCRDSLPGLQAMAAGYSSEEVAFVTVNVDEDASAVAEFVADVRLSLPIWRDPKAEVLSVSVPFTEAPSAFLLDREGMVRAMYVGYNAQTHATQQRDIQQLLAE